MIPAQSSECSKTCRSVGAFAAVRGMNGVGSRNATRVGGAGVRESDAGTSVCVVSLLGVRNDTVGVEVIVAMPIGLVVQQYDLRFLLEALVVFFFSSNTRLQSGYRVKVWLRLGSEAGLIVLNVSRSGSHEPDVTVMSKFRGVITAGVWSFV